MADAQAKTRRQRVEAKEQAIIAAARTIFRKSGFEKTKIADIAKRAGVAEGSVYTYFENKNALLFAVAVEFYDRLTRDAADGTKKLSSTNDRLEFLAGLHLARVSDEWPLLALAMTPDKTSEEYRKTKGYQLNRTYVEVFDQVIRDGINRKDIRDDIPLSVIRDIFYGGLEYSARTRRLRPKATDMEMVITSFMKVLAAGIYPVASAAPKKNDMARMMTRLENATAKLEAITG